jgi:hypothetical protein
VNPEPQLVVEGRKLPVWLGPGCVVVVIGAILAGIIALGFEFAVEFLGSPAPYPRWALELPFYGWGFALFVVAPVASALGLRAVKARTGRVVFDEQGIEFEKGQRRRTLGWSRVVGYGARSHAFVQIHVDDAPFPLPTLAVPTPTEAVRESVIALLDRRGVPRKD